MGILDNLIPWYGYASTKENEVGIVDVDISLHQGIACKY
jgi:hypothetical protein